MNENEEVINILLAQVNKLSFKTPNLECSDVGFVCQLWCWQYSRLSLFFANEGQWSEADCLCIPQVSPEYPPYDGIFMKLVKIHMDGKRMDFVLRPKCSDFRL